MQRKRITTSEGHSHPEEVWTSTGFTRGLQSFWKAERSQAVLFQRKAGTVPWGRCISQCVGMYKCQAGMAEVHLHVLVAQDKICFC